MPIRDARHHRTCTVTRPPTAGQSGITTVVANLPCSNPWPASKATREIPLLATIVELYEATADEAQFKNDDTITMDDGTIFKIKMAQRWQASRLWHQPFYFLVMEKPSE